MMLYVCNTKYIATQVRTQLLPVSLYLIYIYNIV